MLRWTPALLLVVLLGCPTVADDLIRHTGYMEIAPYTRGKNTRTVTVHKANGERVVIEVRYKKSYLKYVNKRVVVQGGPPPPPEDERMQRAIYFHVSEIDLASGEKPWDRIPVRVPAPPLVESQKAIDALKGSWGLATGAATFTFDPPLSKKAEMYTLSRVLITWTDGTQVSHAPHKMIHTTNTARYEDGKQATILFETSREGKLYAQESCLGRVPRCGVED